MDNSAQPTTTDQPVVPPAQTPPPSNGAVPNGQNPQATPAQPVQPSTQQPVPQETSQANGQGSASDPAQAVQAPVQPPAPDVPKTEDQMPVPQQPESAQPPPQEVTTTQQSSEPAGTQQASEPGESSQQEAEHAKQDTQQAPPEDPQTPEENKEKTDPPKVEESDSSAQASDNQSYDQLGKLKQRVKNSDVPEDLRVLLDERISRLELLRSSEGGASSSYILEYENTARYINWSIDLPWHKRTEDLLDLVKAREILDKNHYGLEPVKNRILEYLATVILNLKNKTPSNLSHAPVLCLVGLAGTGKTSLAFSIAEALGKKFERIPFGGMADSRVLRGQSRAFADSEPGAIIKRLVKAQSRNPVFLLDELDRVTESARADIMGVLLEILDPGQNRAFIDHYIDYPFDLSQVMFIATGNNTTNISTAVLDRLEIIQMPSYTDEEKSVIAHRYLFNKIRQQTGLTDKQLIVEESVWPGMIRPLGFDSGIRSLQRIIDGMCRKAARLIVEGKTEQVIITNDNVKGFLPPI